MCCAWFADDYVQATWAYVLETVRGAVRRLSKISNCAFECNYYYYYWQAARMSLYEKTKASQHWLPERRDLEKESGRHSILQGLKRSVFHLTDMCTVWEVPELARLKRWDVEKGSGQSSILQGPKRFVFNWTYMCTVFRSIYAGQVERRGEEKERGRCSVLQGWKWSVFNWTNTGYCFEKYLCRSGWKEEAKRKNVVNILFFSKVGNGLFSTCPTTQILF